ncbi:MAG: mannose-1-phosphate guanylyltransferase/mannose-6-phosphate isomerase [Rhodobacteraceae bacterium]|nr:mannose-1-phosphate guanylyltransferase/mannose-6-phosphate isomerase [Paracoccaceae bacterium]MYF46379.1 mannose-1-phosphate guanylyltransferase/mannose-6-phosphate isomerase [Paracoccaceae bacterium]MYI92150.1 mannose-1-phosphate guanylyltransferase/mannose-6-phosphate isomerase [Paracoccaceae bacterium]
MNHKICPVVLCGGVGKRLWPVSRQTYPKQFSRFLGQHSLFQNTVNRFNDPRFESPLILTSNEYRFIIGEQLNQAEIRNSGIIVEPNPRDTAPAILAAALQLNKKSGNSIMLVLPSDHSIGNEEELISLIYNSQIFVEAGEIITIGIKPDRCETGYGWIEPSETGYKNSNLFRVKQFYEKPELEKAEYFYKQGKFLWNSGIYLFSTETIIEAFKEYSPKLSKYVSIAVENSTMDLDFIRLDEKSWNYIEPISIDFALMEKVPNILVTPYEFGWDDLGDWNAVWRENQKDQNGISSSGNVFSSKCKNSYLRSENANQILVALGCEDLVVVSTPDAVLVTKTDQTQDVKNVVNQLELAGYPQAWQNLVENRYWGKAETLLNEEKVQINRLEINPGKNIVLQRHSFRSEHWIVLKGKASIVLDDKKIILRENQSLNVPMGAKHSLSNLTDEPLIIVEVKTGTQLGMNDTERFEI